MLKKIFLTISFWLIQCLSISVFVLVSHSGIDSWITDLLGIAIPFLILFNTALVVFVLFFARKARLLLPLILTMLIGLKPFRETFALNFKFNNGKSDFTVVSFNIATFNTARMADKSSDSIFNLTVYKWLRENKNPDILCIQEFYHSDLIESDNALDSIAQIGNYKYYYVNPVYIEEYGGIFGVITFSKFPAFSQGEVKFGDGIINKGNYHDFSIKGDTVRVFNFHLNSMSIRWNRSDTLPFFSRLAWNSNDIYQRLRSGYVERKKELEEIEEFIAASPYKMIICADINALPYSSTYQLLKNRLDNAFEKAGRGLGFTYRHFPWFIRIDNQFFDRRLKIDYYKTHRSIKKSDHYPIEAGYSFP